MNNISPTMLIAALFLGTTTQSFAATTSNEAAAGQKSQASPTTRTVFVKLDDISYSQKSIDVKPG